MLQRTLESNGYKFGVITRKVSEEDREQNIQNFRTDPDIKGLLLSAKIGGVGLNLAEATIVIALDKAWNSATNNQMYDRAHRLTQEHPVNIYEILAKDTVDEYVEEIVFKKDEEITSVLGNNLLKSVLSK
jgi:SNF2 family DNA or RNA helicase